MGQQDYLELLGAAHRPNAAVTLALAGVIAQAACRLPPYDVPIAGLDAIALSALRKRIFPNLLFSLMPDQRTEAARCDEFDDLLELLLDHRTVDDDESRWLAHAVATASMGTNHLWQDMGLADRGALSWLMTHHFSALAMRNTGDMKWKKFFYRQLCERASLFICRSPSCGVCTDYAQCFGPEEGVPFAAQSGAAAAQASRPGA